MDLMRDLAHLCELYVFLNHPHLVTYFQSLKLVEQNNLGAKTYYSIIMA